jgi:hypothetical protein
MTTRYTLVTNDKEFVAIDPNHGKGDMPLGYPCLVRFTFYDERRFIYVPPKVKDLDSFVAGVNAVC